MSTIRHRSRIRPSRAKHRIIAMMRTITEARFSTAGRRPYMSRLPINPTTGCRSIIPLLTILSLTRYLRTLRIWADTRGHGTWDMQGRRTIQVAPRPIPSWPLSTPL